MWGIGFPGWHIECSAMSMKYLNTIDIHMGIDHIPVHHTNRSKSGVTGVRFSNYWMHTNHILINDQNFQSLGNGITLENI